MRKLTTRQVREYLQRSYRSADGLWFVKTEAVLGFDRALEIDRQVWEIMPKIQARLLKEYTRAGDTPEGLRECLLLKLRLDGFASRARRVGRSGAFTITVTRCPWFDTIVRSGRGRAADRIGRTICAAEYAVWAREFGDRMEFRLGSRLCKNGASCTFSFIPKP